jgi:hypothetical protein
VCVYISNKLLLNIMELVFRYYIFMVTFLLKGGYIGGGGHASSMKNNVALDTILALKPGRKRLLWDTYEGLSKSFRTGRLQRGM